MSTARSTATVVAHEPERRVIDWSAVVVVPLVPVLLTLLAYALGHLVGGDPR